MTNPMELGVVRDTVIHVYLSLCTYLFLCFFFPFVEKQECLFQLMQPGVIHSSNGYHGVKEVDKACCLLKERNTAGQEVPTANFSSLE